MQQRVESCKELIRRGMSERDICTVLKMSPNTVSKIRTGDYNPRPCGRPSCLTGEHVRFIEANSLADARLTDQEMTEMVRTRFDISVSRSTICRIRQRLGFVFRPPMVIQELNDAQISARIEFCRWIVENKDEVPNIVFTDESRFQKGAENQWRRIRRGQWNETCFTTKEKFPLTVMVWGAIGHDYRSPLMECSNSVNAAEYVNILDKSDMLSEMNERHGRGKWTLMQDGAPCHLAHSTLEWLDQRHVCTVPGWPPNSPDLNPIEQVWGIMKVLLRKNPPRNKQELCERLREVWASIGQRQINSMIDSFIDRCRMVLAVNGRSISQHLSSHRYVAPVDVPATVWSDDADRHLIDLVTEHGRRWKVIGNLCACSPMAAKNRYFFLVRREANRQHRDWRALPPIDSSHPPDSLVDLPLPDFLASFADGAGVRNRISL